jgi:DNA polymerase IV
VTAPLLDRGSATAIAAEILAAIHAETGLTTSAGLSYNKFLAKLASDHRKLNGLFVITPRMDRHSWRRYRSASSTASALSQRRG